MIEKRVELCEIDPDIGKQKRAARRIPRPLAEMLGRDGKMMNYRRLI